MFEQTERTPSLDSPGIAVAAGEAIECQSGEPIWIDAAALFPAEAECDVRHWCRSLFILCVSEQDQAPLLANLLKDRIVAADAVERCESDGGPALRIPLHFDLAQELGVKLETARYFFQISARQYRSRVVTINVT